MFFLTLLLHVDSICFICLFVSVFKDMITHWVWVVSAQIILRCSAHRCSVGLQIEPQYQTTNLNVSDITNKTLSKVSEKVLALKYIRVQRQKVTLLSTSYCTK